MTKKIQKKNPGWPLFEHVFDDETLPTVAGTADLDFLKSELPEKYSEEDFDIVAAPAWLPRLQLMSSNSEKCKKGEFPVNHYALVVGQTFNDLGTEVDALNLAWRPRAMDLSGDNIVTVYDPKSKEFQDIVARSAEQNSGCMYGVEFLLYIPSAKTFAGFFMGSKTARNEAPNVKAKMHEPITLKHQIIENKRYSWAGPIVVSCTTPFEIPPKELILAEVHKFQNPPEREVELADEEATGDHER